MVRIHHGLCEFPLLRQLGYPRDLGPVAFPACATLGTAGPPPVMAGRRPPITRGLALSATKFKLINHNAKQMPFLRNINLLNIKGILKVKIFLNVFKWEFYCHTGQF